MSEQALQDRIAELERVQRAQDRAQHSAEIVSKLKSAIDAYDNAAARHTKER